MDALVTPGAIPPEEKTSLSSAGDLNKDRWPDFTVQYVNGQSQVLYLIP